MIRHMRASIKYELVLNYYKLGNETTDLHAHSPENRPHRGSKSYPGKRHHPPNRSYPGILYLKTHG